MAKAKSQFLETSTEKQNAAIELIKKFQNIEDVVPTVEAAVAAVKQAKQRRAANAGKKSDETQSQPPPKATLETPPPKE